MNISFFVPGQVRGKGRPRFARMGKFTKVYTDEKTESYEAKIGMYYRQAAGPFFSSPIQVRITAVVNYPQSWSQKKKLATPFPAKKPDIDNVIKCVLDGLNKIAFRDDVQVIEVFCQKKWGEEEGLLITIESAQAGKE